MLYSGEISMHGFRNYRESLYNEMVRLFSEEGRDVQPVRADRVLGRDHVLCAYYHARRAVMRGRSASKRVLTEMLLYLACERQIKNAIDAMKPDSGEVVAIVFPAADEETAAAIGRRLGMKSDGSVIDMSASKAQRLNIFSVAEGAAGTPDIVLQQMALFELLK